MRLKLVLSALLVTLFTTSQAQFVSSIHFNIEKSCEATEVKSQGRTGTCWSFSATSFLESEMIRQGKPAIDLSEIFTVRNIYLEKAVNYVRRHGTVNFSQGSLAHDVYRSYAQYGAMPESAYSGKKGDIHNHSDLETELKSFLDTLLTTKPIRATWQTEFKEILDKHLGEVPESFIYEGEKYTPLTFAKGVVGLKMDDYIGITSFAHQPFYEEVVVDVPDNFSNGEYYNLPLGEMMKLVNHALHNGYSIEWDGDVSEKGFMTRKGLALLLGPDTQFDSLPAIPEEQTVNQETRQAAFDAQETTDDHLMHITGIAKGPDGKHYYVVKNSWGSKVSFQGYMMMSEAYFAMKTVCIYIHKDGIPENTKANLLIR